MQYAASAFFYSNRVVTRPALRPGALNFSVDQH